MKIFLIRHGEQEYPYNERGEKMVSGNDAPLIELGKEQLRQLGGELLKEGQTLNVLYISPLLRAQQSAIVLADAMNITNEHLNTIYDLREVDPCSAIGFTYKELEARDKGDIYAHPFGEDQESLNHLVERGRKAMREILEDVNKHGFEFVGVVGHGDALCALDWGLKNEGFPLSYAEMKSNFYPQKGEALMYTLGPDLRIIGEGRIITTESAVQTKEGFRSSNKEVR